MEETRQGGEAVKMGQGFVSKWTKNTHAALQIHLVAWWQRGGKIGLTLGTSPWWWDRREARGRDAQQLQIKRDLRKWQTLIATALSLSQLSWPFSQSPDQRWLSAWCLCANPSKTVSFLGTRVPSLLSHWPSQIDVSKNRPMESLMKYLYHVK